MNKGKIILISILAGLFLSLCFTACVKTLDENGNPLPETIFEENSEETFSRARTEAVLMTEEGGVNTYRFIDPDYGYVCYFSVQNWASSESSVVITCVDGK